MIVAIALAIAAFLVAFLAIPVASVVYTRSEERRVGKECRL